jgi:hypothetical protein
VRPSIGTGAGRADQAAVEAGQGHAAGADGQADPLADLGDDADVGKRAVVAGDEDDAFIGADVDRQRDAHARENHGVL